MLPGVTHPCECKELCTLMHACMWVLLTSIAGRLERHMVQESKCISVFCLSTWCMYKSRPKGFPKCRQFAIYHYRYQRHISYIRITKNTMFKQKNPHLQGETIILPYIPTYRNTFWANMDIPPSSDHHDPFTFHWLDGGWWYIRLFIIHDYSIENVPLLYIIFMHYIYTYIYIVLFLA